MSRFFTTAFLNGAGVSMIYGYIFAFFGALATCASMAEMASMYDSVPATKLQTLKFANRYPISGGQYHWVALLAPPRQAKFLSWLTGTHFGHALINLSDDYQVGSAPLDGKQPHRLAHTSGVRSSNQLLPSIIRITYLSAGKPLSSYSRSFL